MNDNICLSKGVYKHPQQSGYLSVKQYMIVKQNSKPCLLLNFYNESPLKINTAEFILVQKDSDGRVLKSKPVVYENLSLKPGAEHYTKDGIILENGCSDFELKPKLLVSDMYRYVFKSDHVAALYNKRSMNRKETARSGGSISRRSFKESESRLLARIGALAILAVLAVCALSWFIGKPEPEALYKGISYSEASEALMYQAGVN